MTLTGYLVLRALASVSGRGEVRSQRNFPEGAAIALWPKNKLPRFVANRILPLALLIIAKEGARGRILHGSGNHGIACPFAGLSISILTRNVGSTIAGATTIDFQVGIFARQYLGGRNDGQLG